jgi:hypothetical protein
MCATAPLCVPATARAIYQNAPHQLSSKREEMAAVLPMHVFLIDQPEICLMDQSSGLQGIPRILTSHVVMGQAM